MDPSLNDQPVDGHLPVLVDRVVELLAPALQSRGAVLVDATLGLGGHAAAVLRRCPRALLVGMDRDPFAVEAARARLVDFGDRVTCCHTRYDRIGEVVDQHGRATPAGKRCADAVLFDLGVSSLQLDEPQRGFSYARDAPLDMRMDPSGSGAELTAAGLLNTWSVDDIATVLRDFGEERFARRIAAAVVRARTEEPFTSSARLVDIVRAAVPAAARRTGGHPAKRTFQALRIAVNDELVVLRQALPAAIDVIAPNGRLVVLAYQSLEDRIVKTELSARARSQVPDDFPVVPAGHGPQLRLLTRGAERADESEVAVNRRARSVRLRAAERIAVAA